MKRADKNGGRLLGVHCSISGGVENAPISGGELGCTAIQLFTSNNRQWSAPEISEKSAQAFQRNMDDGGVRVAFAHAKYLINLASPDDVVRKRSIDAMIGEIERADALGLPFVVIHPGSPKDRGRDWGIERIANAIDHIFDKTLKSSVSIALETTAGQGSNIGSTFEDLAEIIDLVRVGDRMCVCLDTCHIFAAGYELRTKGGYAKTWNSFGEVIGLDRLVALHLNDSMMDFGSRKDRHEHIGDGKIGLDGFKNIMKDSRLKNIPMILETPKMKGDDEGDVINLDVLRKLI